MMVLTGRQEVLETFMILVDFGMKKALNGWSSVNMPQDWAGTVLRNKLYL